MVLCCRDKLEQALMSGTSLVVDRYAYSGAAYTAAKQIAGHDLQWCKVTSAEDSRLMFSHCHLIRQSARLLLVDLGAQTMLLLNRGRFAGRGLLKLAP